MEARRGRGLCTASDFLRAVRQNQATAPAKLVDAVSL